MRKEKSEYDQDAHTPYIPYYCWWRLYYMWRYAEHISRPLNIHCEFHLPLSMDGKSQIKFQQSLLDKVENRFREYGVEPYYILGRHSDPVTNRVTIDLLIHSPVELIIRLKQDLLTWKYVNTISIVDHLVRIRSDGKPENTFLRLFSAISPELARQAPSYPCNPSGPILGPRTEYSENLVDRGKRRKASE